MKQYEDKRKLRRVGMALDDYVTLHTMAHLRLSQRLAKPTIRLVRQAKISLRISPVLSKSSLIPCAFKIN